MPTALESRQRRSDEELGRLLTQPERADSDLKVTVPEAGQRSAGPVLA